MLLNGTPTITQYETFLVEIEDKIAHVRLNRPKKANALNATAWQELQQIFQALDTTPEARVVILSGEGKNFCSGIDLALLMSINNQYNGTCEGRKREQIRDFIYKLQAPVNAIEQCRKPVLAAIHGACVGGAVDIVTACDMRYATEDAFFSIAEINMGMVADLGTMQRLPKLIGDGITRELAYTGRRMYGDEAQAFQLVNRTFADKGAMIDAVYAIARQIAANSPLSVRGTKQVLLHTRDHSVADGLDFIASWNAGLILSDDLMEAGMAFMQKRTPVFVD